jgi:ERO1-like protein alpha
VWDAIYSQPCFRGVSSGSCATDAPQPEVRMFYRLISGLHASISTHIAAEYLVDPARGVWGQNMALWHARVGAHRERQENLYFTTLFVLRAVLKAEDFLRDADYRTGSPGCAQARPRERAHQHAC